MPGVSSPAIGPSAGAEQVLYELYRHMGVAEHLGFILEEIRRQLRQEYTEIRSLEQELVCLYGGIYIEALPAPLYLGVVAEAVLSLVEVQ